MRGIDLIAAVAVVAETGYLSRFQNPRELMGYLGLVPSESSTGNKANRGGITKAGNGRARHMLVEAAWSYRYPAARESGQAAESGGCAETGARGRMERANEVVRTLPVTCPQRKAADDRRHSGCPRAIGIHLGDPLLAGQTHEVAALLGAASA
jgi:transposase